MESIIVNPHPTRAELTDVAWRYRRCHAFKWNDSRRVSCRGCKNFV